MRNIISLSMVLLLGISTVTAQVKYTAFPKNLQLYARNQITNTATVKVSGNVTMPGASYPTMRLKIFRNDVLISTQNQEMVYIGSKAGYLFTYSIIAELANYTFSLYGVNGPTETLLKTAEEVVAGDAYIINGQSNAETYAYDGNSVSYKSDFIRIYGMGYVPYTTNIWHHAKGDVGNNIPGNAGQWGLVLARQIIDNYNIPVAIFNAAEGGQPIDYFQRNDLEPLNSGTNYGRLFSRIKETGLQNFIRGYFWYQGESDAFGMTTVTYKSKFNSLYDDLLIDFPAIEQFYLFQIKYGCGSTKQSALKIQEALRQLSIDHPNVKIMSTTGSQSFVDACHFIFVGGYEFFGLNMSRLVLRDLYNAPFTNNIEAPAIIAADLVTPTQLNITFANVDDDYIWEAGVENDFTINGTDAVITSGVFSGNVLTLSMSEDASDITTISFSGHTLDAEPYIYNSNGVGILCFRNFSVNIDLRKENSITENILISPNPATDNLTISNLEGLNYTSINIFDISGRIYKVMKSRNDNPTLITLNITDLPAGIYQLHIINESETKQIEFVKI